MVLKRKIFRVTKGDIDFLTKSKEKQLDVGFEGNRIISLKYISKKAKRLI